MKKPTIVFVKLMFSASCVLGLSHASAQPDIQRLGAGPQVGVEVVMSGDPITTTSTALEPVPNAVLTWTTRDSVLLEVDLTAECRLFGGNLSGEFIEIYANISSSIPLDGFPKSLEPGAFVGSPLAFCAADLWEAHGASWATVVPAVRGSNAPVTYTIEILWRNNVAGNTAWLDDWKMTLRASKKPD